MRLKDKVSVITGAGSGIGRAAALRFAQEGSKVIVADIVQEGGEGTVDAIKASGGDAAFVKVDVAKADQVAAMARFAVERYGKVNVLFNNAGISRLNDDGVITELKEEIWDLILATNLKSVFLSCKYVFPELIKAGGGSVVNTASVSGLVASERPCYSAAKGGMIALTRSLAAQFAYANIRVNAIAPGAVETALVAGQRPKVTRAPMPAPLSERVAKPEEIANLVLFLASDEASNVTGATYPIDGGVTAR